MPCPETDSRWEETGAGKSEKPAAFAQAGFGGTIRGRISLRSLHGVKIILLDNVEAAKGNLALRHGQIEGREADYAKPTGLHKEKDHELSKTGKPGGIHGYQPGHANRRRGGEKGVHIAQGLDPAPRLRQRKKPGTDENDRGEETEQHQLFGRKNSTHAVSAEVYALPRDRFKVGGNSSSHFDLMSRAGDGT